MYSQEQLLVKYYTMCRVGKQQKDTQFAQRQGHLLSDSNEPNGVDQDFLRLTSLAGCGKNNIKEKAPVPGPL